MAEKEEHPNPRRTFPVSAPPGAQATPALSPPPGYDGAAVAPQGSEGSAAFLDAVYQIKFIGPWVKAIVVKWGWAVASLLLFAFVAGFVLGAALFVFGVAPVSVIPSRYKKAAGAEGSGAERSLGKDVGGPLPLTRVGLQDEPDWLQLYHEVFRREAADRKESGGRVGVIVVALPVRDKLNRFVWTMAVKPEYQVGIENARAFRLTAGGLIEPLQSDRSERRVNFTVTPSEVGDRLFALVWVKWEQGQPPAELADLFDSSGR